METKLKKEEYFIEQDLPKPLSESETLELLNKAQEGNKKAIDKIIIHNIRLVISRVINNFDTVDYDKRDLVSIGNIGLIKAVNTFDKNKKTKFNSYAVRCIDNEILMFLRKVKKNNQVDSFEKIITSNNQDILTIKDTLSDNSDLEQEYINKDLNLFIQEIIKTFPDRDIEIIKMFFGFYNGKIYTQKEIAQKFNITQSCVSSRVNISISKIRKILEKNQIMEQKKTRTRKKY